MAGSTSIIPQMANGDNIAVHTNGVNDSFSPSAYGGRNYELCTGLYWGVTGGYVNLGGTWTSVANVQLTLTNSTTNYIEADPATGGFSTSTTRTAGKVLLYSVVTSGGVVTSYIDYRLNRTPVQPHLSLSVAGSSDTTLTADQSDPAVTEYTFTGALTGNKSVIFPLKQRSFCVLNSTTGDFTLTIKGPSGTGIVVPRGAHVTLFCNGTNVLRRTDNSIESGGAVTQATSKSTGVTLHNASGEITLNNAALAAATVVKFTVTCNAVAATDHIIVHRKSGGTASSYRVWCDAVAAGSFDVCVENLTAGSLSEAVVLSYRVIGGKNS